MSKESVDSILNMNAADYWSTSLGYASVDEISGITVVYNGVENVIEKNTEEETDSDGSTTTTNSYTCNGNEVDSDLFGTFYNRLVGMTAQSKDSTLTPVGDDVFTVTYHLADGDQTVSYSLYNENFYLGIDTEGRPGLVGKTSVKELISSYEALGL